MRLNDNTLQEIRVLALFNPASMLEGIKVHHEADAVLIAAAQRLYDKGMSTQPDGGYLTDRGKEAVLHLDNVLSLLCNVDTAKA